MELTGRIIAVLPERSGISQRSGSEWKVASYVLETQDQYPKKMNFEVFGSDRIQQLNIQAGEMLTVSFDIDAREYNGRWYNQIRAFAVNRDVQAPAAAPQGGTTPFEAAAPAAGVAEAPVAPAPTAEMAPFSGEASEDGSDLPF